MTRQIRFGILCDSTVLRRWQADVVRHLIDSDGIECRLVVTPQPETGARRPEPGWQRYLSRPVREWFWLIYFGLVRRRIRALDAVDCGSVLNRADVLAVETERRRSRTYFSEDAVAAIRRHELDFLLRFSFGIIDGPILEAARHGVWSFHHGDEREFRGSPPGFWEVYTNRSTTGAILQRLNRRLDGGIVLRRGCYRTKLTFPRNLDHILQQSVLFPTQVARQLQFSGDSLEDLARSETTAPVRRNPGALQILAYFPKALVRTARTAARLLFYTDVWNIGVASIPIHEFARRRVTDTEICWHPAVAGAFLADPFLDSRTGTTLSILAEEFSFERGKGHIVATQFDAGSEEFGLRATALAEEFHLSYPYRIDGDRMVPESHESGAVRFYDRGEDGTFRLSRVALAGVAGIDPTVVRYQSRWWMFLTDRNFGPHHHLNLYFADDIDGAWTPHPLNPVKTDVRSARPAGTPYVQDGQLYRPAMDYSEKVEGRISICRVDTMTTEEFHETTIASVDPISGSLWGDKIHTLTECGELTLIDGCREKLTLLHRHAFRYSLKSLASTFLRRIGRSG